MEDERAEMMRFFGEIHAAFSSPVDAHRSAYHRLRLQLGDNAVEMLEVEYFEVDLHTCDVPLPLNHFQIIDIAVACADHGSDLGERARLVEGRDLDTRRKPLAQHAFQIPAHIEPALDLVFEGAERGRLDWVDR